MTGRPGGEMEGAAPPPPAGSQPILTVHPPIDSVVLEKILRFADELFPGAWCEPTVDGWVVSIDVSAEPPPEGDPDASAVPSDDL